MIDFVIYFQQHYEDLAQKLLWKCEVLETMGFHEDFTFKAQLKSLRFYCFTVLSRPDPSVSSRVLILVYSTGRYGPSKDFFCHPYCETLKQFSLMWVSILESARILLMT